MSDRTTVDDLDDDQIVRTTRGGSVVHPDPDCPQLTKADVTRTTARLLRSDRLICLDCLGEGQVDDSSNPRETRKRLEEMSPGELGSSIDDLMGGSA